MPIKSCIAIAFLVIFSSTSLSQKPYVHEKYSNIIPFVSTLEDVTKIHGEGYDIVKGQDRFLSATYKIGDHVEVNIDYFRDCNQTAKPENERTWIVEDVFFTFEEDLKLQPKDVFIDKRQFTACPYGDIVGQILYFNKDKNVRFTFLSLAKSVSSLRIMPTEIDKGKYPCKKSGVVFALDPESLRCKV